MADIWRDLTLQESDGSLFSDQSQFGDYRPNVIQNLLISICKATILKRGLFRGRMTSLILALGKGKLDIFFRGCAYRIFGENNLIEYGLLLNPKYNQSDLDFLLAGSDSSSNFLDIGSNIGLYSLPLAKSAPKGKTISIDANPKMKARLEFNASASGLKNVTMVSSAVSDKVGTARLKIRKDDVAIVAIEESAHGDIPIRTLSDIVKEQRLTSIYGLKIDIEGHEDRALVPFLMSASDELLPKRIVIEHPQADQDYPGCVKAFAALGYVLSGRSRNNSFYLRP